MRRKGVAENTRIQIDVGEDLLRRTQKAIPWGYRNNLLRNVIEQLVSAIEEEGLVVAALILDGRLTLFGRRE